MLIVMFGLGALLFVVLSPLFILLIWFTLPKLDDIPPTKYYTYAEPTLTVRRQVEGIVWGCAIILAMIIAIWLV